MTIHSINAAFDSGNIVVESIDGATAALTIRKDKDSDFFQWFHFRVVAEAGEEIVLRITGLEKSAYPGGWPITAPAFPKTATIWGRADTGYDGRGWRHADHPLHARFGDLAWFAYFAPYSMERHHDLWSPGGLRRRRLSLPRHQP
jgi:hypothetical protein